MAKVIRFEACPHCREAGRDKAGDNLGVYADGGSHCFSCGRHRAAKSSVRKENQSVNDDKDVLPFDFTREVPAAGWRWLLQYGLPYTYWTPYVGFSESTSRLIVTVGRPVQFSIGRYVGDDHAARARDDKTFRKWRIWGDRYGFADVLGADKDGPVVLVEDVISWHKVGQVAPSICLFGTKVSDAVLKRLIALKRPVSLWLDADQYTLLPPKLNRIAALTGASVRYIKTDKDPKGHTEKEINEIVRSTTEHKGSVA